LTGCFTREEVELPKFDFIRRTAAKKAFCCAWTKRRLWSARVARPQPPSACGCDCKKLIFRLYVSALTTLNLDDHNRVPTTSIRLLGAWCGTTKRGALPLNARFPWGERTRGRRKVDFPVPGGCGRHFQHDAHLRARGAQEAIFPLLTAVKPESPYYDEAHSIVQIPELLRRAKRGGRNSPTSIYESLLAEIRFIDNRIARLWLSFSATKPKCRYNLAYS
jgi:uridine kinase